MPINVFLSHAHNERELAEAVKRVLEDTSQGALKVWFSSDIRTSGGIEAGEQWREQIQEHLEKSDHVIAVQTPASTGRPWIMWECGLASGVSEDRGIIPIVFGMGRDDLNNPLNTYQAYSGEDREQVGELCRRLANEAELDLREHALDPPLNSYMEAIEVYKPRRAIKQERMEIWRSRFEEYIQTGRLAEVIGQREMMYSGLGIPFQPVEPSVHELLSRVLMDLEEYELAIQEVDYALSIIEDDIQLLHRKALAYMGLGDRNAAFTLVKRVYDLNEKLRHNPEIAGLEGRIHRERWENSKDEEDLVNAIDAYLRAFEADPRQYYPGINAATLTLIHGEKERAKELYKRVLDACEECISDAVVPFWVNFTRGEAHLGLGNEERAIECYKQGVDSEQAPSQRERKSALKGVLRVSDARKLADETISEIRSVLE